VAFGQSDGPSASSRQVKDLLELLQNAGHADFRDARGPMGFNQRQAGGRFTSAEAAAFIEQLQAAEYEATLDSASLDSASLDPEGSPAPSQTPSKGPMTDSERAIRTASTKSLVLEVRRRGWIVTKPKP